jgi:hypothetical protein
MMDICCGKCGVKEKIDATPVSQYLIKLKAQQAGWYVDENGKLYCPDCRRELRGVRKK